MLDPIRLSAAQLWRRGDTEILYITLKKEALTKIRWEKKNIYLGDYFNWNITALRGKKKYFSFGDFLTRSEYYCKKNAKTPQEYRNEVKKIHKAHRLLSLL